MIEEESERLEAAMGEFVEAVEQENEALYDKLMERLQETEAKLERLSKPQQETTEPQTALHLVSKPEVEVSRREKIRQLTKQGFSTAHIAKLLDVKIGEVEVAVQIEKKRHIH